MIGIGRLGPVIAQLVRVAGDFVAGLGEAAEERGQTGSQHLLCAAGNQTGSVMQIEAVCALHTCSAGDMVSFTAKVLDVSKVRSVCLGCIVCLLE